MEFQFNDGAREMVCGGLAGVLLFFFAIFLFVKVSRDKKKARASINWPSVEGQIIGNRIKRAVQSDGDGTSISYNPEVYYEYQVDGTPFSGQRIAFGSEPSFGSKKKAEQFLAAYPVESSVTVFYNPEDPTEAVLSQTVSKMIGSIIAGILLIVTGLFLLFHAVKGLIGTFLH